MPTGNSRRTARGFTYLGLLGLLVLLGAGLAALGTATGTRVQREKERELRFRGAQFRDAIERYWSAQVPHELPTSADVLLEDRRNPASRHHLRRLFADPFSGQADWVWLRAPDGRGITGVRSRSSAPRLDLAIAPPSGRRALVSDWRFVFEPPAAPRESTP